MRLPRSLAPLSLALLFLSSIAAAAAAGAPAPALAGRLLRADRTPAAGWEISVAGSPVSVPTGADGRFVLTPPPPLPCELVALGPGGELAPPFTVAASDAGSELELVMPELFRDSVTVSAGVAPGLETAPAAATTVVAAEDLEQRRPGRLAEVVEAIPGAHTSGEGPTAVPSLRGLARGRTLLLLDGARVTTERRAGASAGFLDPFTLAGVEVARGPGAVAYGSDALGGVILARSREPERGAPGLRLALERGFGGSDETAAGVEASGDVGPGALLAQLHLRRSGDAAAAGGEPIANSSYRDGGGALRYVVATPLGRLRAGVAVAEARDTGNPAADSQVTRAIYPVESSRRLQLDLAAGARGGWESLDAGLFVGSYRLALDRDRLPTATVARQVESSDTESSDASLRLVGSRPAAGGRLQLGVDVVGRFGLESTVTRQAFDLAGNETSRQATAAIADARRVASGLFATWSRAAGERTLLSLGLRGDHVAAENRGGFFGDRATRHQALSGFAAATVTMGPRLTGTLQVSRGFRDPTLSDRYFRGPSGRGFVVGNSDLEPETSLQWDGSLRLAAGATQVALSAYLYRVDDLVERYRPASDFLFRNRGSAEIRGVELEATRPLGAGLAAELAATWAEGETVDDGAPTDDVPTPGAFATLRWAGPRGYLYGRLAGFLRDDRPGPTEDLRPGYTTLDAGGGWQVGAGLELRVVAKNLLDRRYRESADETAALAMGRNVVVGLLGRW